ncbi:hypothetical protein RJ640_009364 [Escallonia rubra]|uniref:Cyclin-dependent protein kinase inhibitor SMR4 n=1 Tax=Escallonia rubra TaxID=112253 RepID=A0AA88RKJ2_9ASTE|nr:hypothetical protein RJ640_009364 [Escallonia rubra]
MEAGGGGYWEVEDGCSTPKQGAYRIPVATECPPPPRKSRPGSVKQRCPPKNGYFQPPDLETFFAMASRREPF